MKKVVFNCDNCKSENVYRIWRMKGEINYEKMD